MSILKSAPKIETVIIEDPEAVYKFVFPAMIKGYYLSARHENAFKLAYEHGAFERGDYVTIHPRREKIMQDVNFSDDEYSRTIYISCETKGEVIEIEHYR